MLEGGELGGKGLNQVPGSLGEAVPGYAGEELNDALTVGSNGAVVLWLQR